MGEDVVVREADDLCAAGLGFASVRSGDVLGGLRHDLSRVIVYASGII